MMNWHMYDRATHDHDPHVIGCYVRLTAQLRGPSVRGACGSEQRAIAAGRRKMPTRLVVGAPPQCVRERVRLVCECARLTWEWQSYT